MSDVGKAEKQRTGQELPEDLSFEEALERIESIVEQIESGQIGLEESISAYERGVGLIRRCRSILDRAEQRVEELTQKVLGEVDEADGPTDG